MGRFLLHRLSTEQGPYLTPASVHADLASVSLRYLLYNEHWADTSVSPRTCGEIVLGFHDIYPYVSTLFQRSMPMWCSSIR